MSDGRRAEIGHKHSISPVTLSSGSEHSKHSSLSPPKIIGCLNKKADAAVKSSQDYRQSPIHSSDTFRPRKMYQTRKYRSRSRSRDKSLPKRYRSRSRSRSLPKRYRSRSRSRERVNRGRRSRSRSKSYRSRRSRSRSQSRKYRNRRSRSRSNGRTSKRRRSRSGSSSSYSKSSRRLAKSRSRSREHSRRYKSKSPSLKPVDLKRAWETFQAELSALESIKAEEEKLFDKNPEKHPDYNVEWKKFYKGRVQEILESGDDPKLHNFESEWAYFWKFRMSELIKIDYERKKSALKRRLKLPEDAEMPLYLKVMDSRNNVHDSIMHSSLGDSMPSKRVSKGLISTLRIVTAVEEQLGSLGPRVNGLLSEAVSLQRIGGSDPDSLLSNPENFVLLETVKEKLLGQVQSRIVKKSLEGAVEEAINSICDLLQSSAPSNPSLFHSQLYPSQEKSSWHLGSTNESQVNVPGVGVVDRVAIAQQIAEALVRQGKTDVTESELQELVNGVVGMVEAQAAQEREREMAALQERLQKQRPVKPEILMTVPEAKKSAPESPIPTRPSCPVSPPETLTIPDPPKSNQSMVQNPTLAKHVAKDTDALNILMSVVNSGIKKSDSMEKSNDWSSDDSDEPFTIKKAQVTSLAEKKSAADSEKRDKSELQNVKEEFNKTKETSQRNPSPQKQGISLDRKETPKWHTQAKKSPSPEIFKTMKKKVMAAAKMENAKKVFFRNRNLSPFSSREETSNPLPNSDEEDEDLKVIGAWDSDSDIDLDSFGKTKGLAYDKINVKKQSPGKYEKNLSLLNKSKEVLQNTVVASSDTVGSAINLDAAIDNLMGELKNKTSKIEVISGKPQPSDNNSPSKPASQPSKNGQPIPTQIQQISTTNVATQGYNAPYSYPQPQSYGTMQPGYYHNAAVPGYASSVGQSYYTSNQGMPASYYGNAGNLVYCPTNVQWPGHYGTQRTNFPPNARGGAKYKK